MRRAPPQLRNRYDNRRAGLRSPRCGLMAVSDLVPQPQESSRAQGLRWDQAKQPWWCRPQTTMPASACQTPYVGTTLQLVERQAVAVVCCTPSSPPVSCTSRHPSHLPASLLLLAGGAAARHCGALAAGVGGSPPSSVAPLRCASARAPALLGVRAPGGASAGVHPLPQPPSNPGRNDSELVSSREIQRRWDVVWVGVERARGLRRVLGRGCGEGGGKRRIGVGYIQVHGIHGHGN